MLARKTLELVGIPEGTVWPPGPACPGLSGSPILLGLSIGEAAATFMLIASQMS